MNTKAIPSHRKKLKISSFVDFSVMKMLLRIAPIVSEVKSPNMHVVLTRNIW